MLIVLVLILFLILQVADLVAAGVRYFVSRREIAQRRDVPAAEQDMSIVLRKIKYGHMVGRVAGKR